MKKTFCDCCEQEITQWPVVPLKILSHITDNPINARTININGEKQYTSTAIAEFEMCLPCYNSVMGAAWEKFETIHYRKVTVPGSVSVSDLETVTERLRNALSGK